MFIWLWSLLLNLDFRMLARWFDRSGIGQYIAPDENAAKEPIPDEASGAFWQFVAPDPNFAPPAAPPREAFLLAPMASGQVLCEHCSRWTNVQTSRNVTERSAVASTPTTSKSAYPEQLFTPSPTRNHSSETETLVLSAAKDTAFSMSSPPNLREARDKVFRLCGSQKALKDSLLKKLRNLLKKDPSLIHARATHLGQLVPDGFTPLMACAHADHVVAAEVILELSPNTSRLERDLQGRTAMHIAAGLGHLNMINLLQKYENAEGLASPAPVDLIGRTPLGRAVTSPNPTARKRQKELESKLFSPGDLSVFGVPRPESERSGKNSTLQITYGIADMPGMRVTMEDAVCSSMWQTNGKSYCLVGVCDGHGDQGNVSKFIADNVPSLLQSHLVEGDTDWDAIWKATCLELDDKLKQQKIPGGSTAVLALITETLIVVANVGDSRAILVQSNSTSTGLEDQIAKLALSEKQNEPPLKKEDEQDQPQHATLDKESTKAQGPTTIALSADHKPDLPEEQARIENAGMKVVPITFQENGKDVTIHKVAKTDSEQLAVSRAFGDFEYKLNTTLAPDEQAIVAVADVRVHARDPNSDMYLILACDGIWDVMDNETVTNFVLDQIKVRMDTMDVVLPEVGDALLRESLNLGSRDNMTTVLVALSRQSERMQPVIRGKALDFGSPGKTQTT